jgi:murein DD-endopeptidase MepM/ murein hydrolase activator NlpD
VSQSPGLKASESSDTVPRMPLPRRERRVSARRRRELERERRQRLLAVVAALGVIGLVMLLLSAFGGSNGVTQTPAPASAARLLPAGPPTPEILARVDALQLQLPVSQSRVTAIGFQGGSDGSIALSPLGTQANEGIVRRLLHAIVGHSSSGPRWYQLPGGEGPATSAIDVGAAAGTDVYAPVDGTIIAIGDIVLNGRPYGSRIDIQPTSAPSLVVSVSTLRVDPALAAGSAVAAGATKLGSLVDISHVEQQALARYTNDAGNHVVIEVHPSASLGLG